MAWDDSSASAIFSGCSAGTFYPPPSHSSLLISIHYFYHVSNVLYCVNEWARIQSRGTTRNTLPRPSKKNGAPAPRAQ